MLLLGACGGHTVRHILVHDRMFSAVEVYRSAILFSSIAVGTKGILVFF